MNREQFFDLVWTFEEIMMNRDHLRSQMGKCGEGCDEEDEGLCPRCLVLFEKVQAEDVRLATNRELDAVLTKLRQACEEDKTGTYDRILRQSREEKVVH